ncbi:MAG: transketolase [Acidimicrobiales bacterium]
MPDRDLALERRAVSVIRGLAMDAPNAARSGHQGTAMALAPLAHVLWTRVMRYDAEAPDWPDRDRFVLSAGHASILLYSMLHLTGFGLTLDDLRAFRQWASRTPGHPEARHTPGVEVTTGPLGQGFANAVGMAMAERWLRARFGAELFDHRVYTVCSDGDLMEGVSHEAASLAGHQRLGRLIAVFDDNRITIDGPTSLSVSDDVARRFEAYGWHVVELGDAGEDLDAIEAGLRAAEDEQDRPSLVVLRTHIAYPATEHTDDHAAHGYAILDEEIAATKAAMGLPTDETFFVPDDVRGFYRAAGRRGGDARRAWQERRDAWAGRVDELEACLAGRGLDGWEAKLPTWAPGDKAVATRVASQACITALVEVVPGLVGGGADLTGNTGLRFGGELAGPSRPDGRAFAFGVREHAMGAALNGMALHGGVIPVGGTFLVFSDYMRPAVRLAALSNARVVFVWTHDSVGVGEDGPTHQPIEQIAALRAIPNLAVLRPADANETAHAWRVALGLPGPAALILSRQNVPVLSGTAEAAAGVARGGYVLREAASGQPELVLVSTGSEVAVCVAAAELLEAEGVDVRVVSLPCWELFEAQPDDYQCEVIPPELAVLGVEAGASFGWERWADDTVSIDTFGESAPGEEALARFGFTAANVAARAFALLEALSE